MDESEKPKFPATKLCVICRSRRESNVLEICYDVFILDPCENNSDSDGFVPRVPDLTFKGLGSMSFCVLNSSLYMFESSGISREIEGIRKSVYTFDLSAFFLSEEKSLKNDSNDCAQLLQPAPCMHGVKSDTAAVVTPRGQILVFSRRVYFEQLPERVDFEVYDPVTSSWRVLPRLCPRREKKSDYYFDITGYRFLSESLFCVTAMNGIGAFALDLDLDGDQEWNRVDMKSLGWYDCGGGQFFILDDDLGLYLTPRGVRRRGRGYFGLFNFPYSWGSETYHQMSLTGVSSNQELRFCNVETMHHHEHFYTTVDAWCCDLAKYKAEMNNNDNDNKGLGCRRLSATRNSFKFAPKVEGEEILVRFFPCAILPFGPEAFNSNSSFSHSHN